MLFQQTLSLDQADLGRPLRVSNNFRIQQKFRQIQGEMLQVSKHAPVSDVIRIKQKNSTPPLPPPPLKSVYIQYGLNVFIR